MRIVTQANKDVPVIQPKSCLPFTFQNHSSLHMDQTLGAKKEWDTHRTKGLLLQNTKTHVYSCRTQRHMSTPAEHKDTCNKPCVKLKLYASVNARDHQPINQLASKSVSHLIKHTDRQSDKQTLCLSVCLSIIQSVTWLVGRSMCFEGITESYRTNL